MTARDNPGHPAKHRVGDSGRRQKKRDHENVIANRSPSEKPISLAPLGFEEAVRDLLKAKPDRRRGKDGDDAS